MSQINYLNLNLLEQRPVQPPIPLSSDIKRNRPSRHCIVPGCKTGKGSHSNRKDKISIFSSPTNEFERKKWEEAIPRWDKPLNEKFSVCEKHFEKHFIEKHFRHVINGNEVLVPRERPILLPGAIPSNFPNLPTHPTSQHFPSSAKCIMNEKVKIKKRCLMSNTNCCVPKCHSRASRERHLSFHKFPATTKYRQEWVRLFKIGKKISGSMVVCSKHFKDEDFFNHQRETVIKRRLKKGVIPSLFLPLSSTDNLEVIQRKEVAAVKRADRRNQREKSKEMNCPSSMSIIVSDHGKLSPERRLDPEIRQEVLQSLEQNVGEKLAQEKNSALTQKKITPEDLWNLEARGNQMFERTTSYSPDTTCKENVLFPVVDIKQEPPDTTLTTEQKMERALALTDKLALFMSESAFFHEHMKFLQSVYDSWAKGKVAMEVRNTISFKGIQDKGSTVQDLPETSGPISEATQTGNLVVRNITVPARDNIYKCPKNITTAMGLSNNKRHNTASLSNPCVPYSVQSHSEGPSSSRAMTNSILPTNPVILHQQNSLSRDKTPVKDPVPSTIKAMKSSVVLPAKHVMFYQQKSLSKEKNPVKDSVPSTIRTILGVIMESQKNKPPQPQDCIKLLNQPSSFTSIPTIVKFNQS